MSSFKLYVQNLREYSTTVYLFIASTGTSVSPASQWNSKNVPRSLLLEMRTTSTFRRPLGHFNHIWQNSRLHTFQNTCALSSVHCAIHALCTAPQMMVLDNVAAVHFSWLISYNKKTKHSTRFRAARLHIAPLVQERE